jgi:peroxiredoxin
MDAYARALPPGTPAPRFALCQSPGQSLQLEALRGQRVVLAFYPALWEPVTDAQVALYQQYLPEFTRRSARLLGISPDSVWSQQAYVRQHAIGFPLLSDHEPNGQVASAYGVYAADSGTYHRAIFVLDEQGMIQWRRTYPRNLVPAVASIFTVLDRCGFELPQQG